MTSNEIALINNCLNTNCKLKNADALSPLFGWGFGGGWRLL